MSEVTEVFGIYIEATAKVGAMIIRSEPYWNGKSAVAFLLNNNGQQLEPYYATYREYKKGMFGKVIAAVFPELPAGNYEVHWTEKSDHKKRATVYPGRVAQVSFP